MSQIGQYISIKAITPVESLTGNIGGPVFPDGAGNIDTVGAGNIFATGNPVAHSMTFTLVGTTDHAIQIGNAAGSLTSLPVATNGQIPIGSVGADPVIANITAGPGIVVANGPGTITLSTDGSVVVTTLHTQDGHNVTPVAGVINISGANGLTTTGTIGPNTVTITAGGSIAQSFPTDAGTATPAAGILNIITNQAAVAAGSSVFFSAPGAANTVQLNVTDALSNTLVGNDAGNLTLTGNHNTGLGFEVLHALTTGSDNGAFGYQALKAATTGIQNTAVGSFALLSSTTASNNIAVGQSALRNNILSQQNLAIGVGAMQAHTTGVANVGLNIAIGIGALGSGTDSYQAVAVGHTALQNYSGVDDPANTALGHGSLNSLTAGGANTALGHGSAELLATGVNNLIVGAAAGQSYTGAESNNLLLVSTGTLGESNTIRIGGGSGGGAFQQNRCFISGIAGVVVANTNVVTINTVTDQLGSQALTPPSGVTWSVITVDQTAVVNMGYFCNKAGTLALALPAASAVGDVIEVTNENTALGVQFTQAAGQQILIGNTNTTLGAAGTLTSSAVGDTLKIVCKVANTIWRVTSGWGNWTPA